MPGAVGGPASRPTGTPSVTRRKLLKVADIGPLLGVPPTSGSAPSPSFPAPVDRWARGDLWAASNVRRWARMYKGGSARWGRR
jgi:hypothetical protein